MPPAPAPSSLGSRVIAALADISGKKASQIAPDDKLGSKLGLTTLQLRALAAPFTEIASDFSASASISPSACEKLGDVRGALTLVSKTAGFDGTIVSNGNA